MRSVEPMVDHYLCSQILWMASGLLRTARRLATTDNLPLEEETSHVSFKGIVSRDFGGLQMILMYRIGVPDVTLEVYLF